MFTFCSVPKSVVVNVYTVLSRVIVASGVRVTVTIAVGFVFSFIEYAVESFVPSVIVGTVLDEKTILGISIVSVMCAVTV